MYVTSYPKFSLFLVIFYPLSIKKQFLSKKYPKTLFSLLFMEESSQSPEGKVMPFPSALIGQSKIV